MQKNQHKRRNKSTKWDFNMPLLKHDRTADKKETHTDRKQNNVINQPCPNDMYITLYPITTVWIFFSSVYKTLSKPTECWNIKKSQRISNYWNYSKYVLWPQCN